MRLTPLAALMLLGGAVHAQIVTSPLDSAPRSPPIGADSVRAAPVADADMRVDGTLAESAWRQADSITVLRQREPQEGTPATEHTVVRVLRSADALYIGIRASDAAARLFRSTQLRRGADLAVVIVKAVHRFAS